MLKEFVLRCSDSTSRQHKSLLNREKLSTSWLFCLPGPNGLSNAAFSEAMALALCMPSSACKGRVGLKIGKRVVDLFWRCFFECLLSKLHQVGLGNKHLAKRRVFALVQEEKMKRERETQWIRKIEGIKMIRTGAIRTN